MGTGFMILYCGISYLKKLIRTLILNSFCESSPFMWLLTVQRWTEQEKKKKKPGTANLLFLPCHTLYILAQMMRTISPSIMQYEIDWKGSTSSQLVLLGWWAFALLLANQIASNGIQILFLDKYMQLSKTTWRNFWEFLFKDFSNFDFKWFWHGVNSIKNSIELLQ